jgi:HEPN domain-containing protein
MMKKRAKLLLAAANECLLHSEESLKREAWNMSIRRAQEAVEIEITAMLAHLGVHYPKVSSPHFGITTFSKRADLEL